MKTAACFIFACFACGRIKGHRILWFACSAAVCCAIAFTVRGSTYAAERIGGGPQRIFKKGALAPFLKAALFSVGGGSPSFRIVPQPERKKQGQDKCFAPLFFPSACGCVCTPFHLSHPRQESNSVVLLCVVAGATPPQKTTTQGRKGRKGGQDAFALSQHFFRPCVVALRKKIISRTTEHCKVVA